MLPAFFGAGCAAWRTDPVERFLDREPQEGKKYVYIHPVSLDLQKELQRLQKESICKFAENLCVSFRHIEGLPDFVIVDFGAWITCWAMGSEVLVDQFLDETTQAANGGGTVCEYAWYDGHILKMGFMVLKDGKIVSLRAPFTDEEEDPWKPRDDVLGETIELPEQRVSREPIESLEDRSMRRTAVAEFLNRQLPQRRKEYVYVYPVGRDEWRLEFRFYVITMAAKIGLVESRFANVHGMQDYIQALRTKLRRGRELWNRDLDEMTEASEGGALCEYKWTNGKKTELGLMAIREGRIVKRFPFSTAQTWEELAESGPVDDGSPGDMPARESR